LPPCSKAAPGQQCYEGITAMDAKILGDAWKSLMKGPCSVFPTWARQDLALSAADAAVGRAAARGALRGQLWMAPVSEVMYDTSMVEFFSAAFEEGSSYLLCH
jgi:hypothetical protein